MKVDFPDRIARIGQAGQIVFTYPGDESLFPAPVADRVIDPVVAVRAFELLGGMRPASRQATDELDLPVQVEDKLVLRVVDRPPLTGLVLIAFANHQLTLDHIVHVLWHPNRRTEQFSDGLPESFGIGRLMGAMDNGQIRKGVFYFFFVFSGKWAQYRHAIGKMQGVDPVIHKGPNPFQNLGGCHTGRASGAVNQPHQIKRFIGGITVEASSSFAHVRQADNR